ncbi:hypothetical protein, partial [Serratia ureilytica]|uniref:hypothetical protein n=1 Tax=Serratia ureilytica TaxID=300181 RepID=UPI001E2C049A
TRHYPASVGGLFFFFIPSRSRRTYLSRAVPYKIFFLGGLGGRPAAIISFSLSVGLNLIRSWP